MPRIMVTRTGRALLPANAEAEKAVLKLPERRPIWIDARRRRSLPAHNMFFGVIAEATLHWPEGADPNPEGDAELLRAWLLCRADHCDKIDFPLPGDDKPRLQQVMAASVADFVNRLRQRGEYPFIREGVVDGTATIRVFVSRSIDHETLDEAAFIPIRDHCYRTIEEVTGAPIENFKREAA